MLSRKSKSATQLAVATVVSPSRPLGSFARHCIQTVVSTMGIDIEVTYYEGHRGVLQKVAETVVSARDVPLIESLMENAQLAQRYEELSQDPELTIKCYAGNIDGKEIDLKCRPNEIEYVIDATRSQTRPVLFLCSESYKDGRSSSEDSGEIMLGLRTASGMVRDLFNIHTCTPSQEAPFSFPPSPPTPGKAESDKFLDASDSETEGSPLHMLPQRVRPATNKSATLPTESNNIRPECYSIQEQLMPLKENGIESPEEDEAESPPMTSSHKVVPSSLPNDSSGSNFVLSNAVSCTSLTKNSPTLSSRFSRIFSSDLFGMRRRRKEDKEIVNKVDHDTTLQQFPTPKRNRPTKNKKKYLTLTPTRSAKVTDISGPCQGFYDTAKQQKEVEKMSFKRTGGFRKIKRRVSSLTSFSPPPILESSYSFQVSSIQVVMEASIATTQNLDVHIREYDTVGELKAAVAKKLNKLDPDRVTPWKGKDLILTYECEDREYELYNEWQFIYKTALYDAWTRTDSTSPVKARPSRREPDKDLEAIHRISRLTGVMLDDRVATLPDAQVGALRKTALPDQREVQWARRTLHSFVDCIAGSRNAEEYSLSIQTVSSGTSTILALKIPIHNKIKITFHYKEAFSLVKKIDVHSTADSVLTEIFPCVVACELVEDKIEEHTLQISGERSYIAGKTELIEFTDIRRCIIKGEEVHLSVTAKPQPERDTPFKLNWLPIDPFSSAPPLHPDIARSGHRETEVQALSVWDILDDFTLRVVKADNLPMVSGRSSQRAPQAVLEATLYHGEKPLCPTVTTSVQLLETVVHWKETLNFKIARKNIPKSAKIMFVIREPMQRRDSSAVKKSPKFLYWGLTTIYDHQGMLYNGERAMALWKGGSKKDSTDETFDPNPSGPASNNSNPRAVTLWITFDSFGFPVYYPSSCPQSWSGLLSQSTNNVAIRKQFIKLLDFIKQGKLHSAVPAYIEKVDWGNLSESLEVYSLLDQIAEARESFPVEIALKLLDCDFPDENVRGFATRVLEQLPDEQLEDFLLQLTQALKFEQHHDSMLARFLLKRALRNKRIGHFFFWYLKCEMYNPQYTTRFGVILEAYLKGCGEDMLKRFEDQFEMQTMLEEIGLELKQRCNDDHSKMQALLPEMLESHRVPDIVLTPVYNPRIQLGNLRPTKCKIMASKKKPQWLEMYNVDETSLRHTPTRLILKLGDDLRQDMITLRMLSLFEKLWEEDGLDLSLIPYGCMATGPNTGFIEVVKNAKTIAEVSGVSNNTKLFEWIKANQKNEFGETDADRVKDAIKMFVHSCAGYSVATYVLGIGDRHNDNIMVTTSGNLFHIDFGHFLGNIKYCMGFKREWAPFVLTPDFVYVMGGEESETFEKYKNLCCRAFLTLRRHAELIINLFSMMRSTGIPELTCVEDTDYIRNALALTQSEHEAEQLFRRVIKKCLDMKWTVQVMWKIHLIRKRGSS